MFNLDEKKKEREKGILFLENKKFIKMKFLYCIFGLLVISVYAVLSAKPNDFCFQTETQIKCEEQYHFKCGPKICSRDKYKCQSLKLWSTLNSQIKLDKDESEISYEFLKFVQRIDDCPMPMIKPTVNGYHKQRMPFRI